MVQAGAASLVLEIGFAFVAGVLTIIAPCTLPVVPLVLGGASLSGRHRTVGILVGFGGAFLATSVLLASLLAAAGATTGGVRTAAALALSLVGASLLVPSIGGWLEARLAPLAEAGARLPGHGSGLAGGLATGVAIGLLWAPCVGPLMAGVLAVAATEGPTLRGLAVAASYVMGAAMPLLLLAIGGRRAAARLGGPRGRAGVQRAFGGLMLAAGLIVVIGADIPLESAIPEILPAGVAGLESSPGTVSAGDGAGPSSQSTAPVALADLGPAPELAGITAWINSSPLTLASLRGKVVLVHFWTFACINCIHVQPYVKAWWERYAAQGLVVIGVHTPELSFERDLGNVRAAVASDGVTFPVAFDPAYATWNAYGNGAWPAFYFIDKAGQIRHTHGGEGEYDVSEQVIRELLAESG